MSDKADKKPMPETQHQRWLKYGLNVAITIIVVIALAVAVIYGSQKSRKRFDRTAMGVNSLKPQTVNIVKDLKSKVTLVSLYSRTANKSEDDPTDYVGRVEDLLDEYRRLSPNIEVEYIDPHVEFSKKDDLIKRVTERYGGEVEKYKGYVAAYPAKYESLLKAAQEQSEAFDKLPRDQIKNRELAIAYSNVGNTIKNFLPELEKTKKQTDRMLDGKPPDYKAVVDIVRLQMAVVGALLDAVIGGFEDNLKNPELPPAFKDYFTANLPKLQAMKKTADDLVDEASKLGELKLDSLKRSLAVSDAILVMGDNDLRVIPREKVWQKSVDRGGAPGSERVKPLFAGEQQISTAIFALTTTKKPKVAILRAGGPPVADSSPFFRSEMSMAEVVGRLREYNFEVVERDYTGQWAMQSQMQGMPAMPEPTDEEIKDAIWVVINTPGQSRMGMPPPSIAAKLKEHLDNGGSALILSTDRADPLAAALDPWGIKVQSEKIALKELVTSEGGRKGTQIEEAEKRLQYVFIVRSFGEHQLTAPLRSLEAALVPIVPVELTPKEGYSGAAIIPVPSNPPSWATSVSELRNNRGEIKFDSKRGDTPSPLFGGAAVEKKDGGRLVVIGSLQFATDTLVLMPDPDVDDAGGIPRFPANAELFANSIYWLAKMDSMIAISPAGPQVSRIAPMSEGASRGWTIGVLLVGLPGLVIAAGLVMYFARRD